MGISGLLTFLSVVGVTVLASAVVTLRLGARRTSERLLAMAVLGHLLVLAPVYALGAFSVLTSWSAVLGTLVADALAVMAARNGRHLRGVVADLMPAWRDLRADVARLMAPASSTFHLTDGVLLGMIGLIVWLTLTCYLAPSFRGYDAPWYHEPITAFAIQERGLHVPELPQRLFYVASLARASEFVSAWLVLITGSRALIELPSVFGFTTLWLATYRLGRILGACRERALGWASVVVLTPGLLAYAQSTYIDLHACAMITATACFALSRPASVDTALLAAVAACLAIAMKLYALGPAAVLSAIVLVRAWQARRERVSGALQPRATMAASALLLTAVVVGLATPIRNALVFANPLYPIAITVPLLGYVLPGPIAMTSRDLYMSPPLGELLRMIFWPLAAYETGFTHYIEVHLPIEIAPEFNYGYAMPTLGLGAALLAFSKLAWAAAHPTWRKAGAAPSRRTRLARTRLATVAVLMLAVAAFFLLFPVTRLARYLGFVFACTGALAATVLVRGRLRRIGDAMLVSALVAQLLLVVVQSPRLLYAPRELWQLAQMSPSQRELAHQHGAFASSTAARFRDHALAAGTTVLFGDDVLEPGPLWNSTVSNRVEYLAGDGDPTEAADRRGAKLVACTSGSPRCRAVEQRSDAWMPVGTLYPKILSEECLVFRRRKSE